ncbi:MAG: hypothetical protein JJT76_11190 [Clostridiaceae bacterium]|nr:hypothetical protein [Clostridiaceae bacterium]
MGLLRLIISIIALIYIFNGFNRSHNPQKKKDVDRRWLNAMFIQYMVVFLGGIFILLFIIYKLVTTQ